MNWEEACQILGIPGTASPAEIQARYLYKAQLLHPDKTAGYPEKVRQQAEEELKRVNAAYAMLKDPRNNARSAPPKLRVSPGQVRFTDAGRNKTAIIQIESVGGPYTKFWMDDSPAPWLKVIEVRSTTGDPLPLEATIEAAPEHASQKQSACDLAIRIENEKTLAKDEVSVKIQLVKSKNPKKAGRRMSWLPKREALASSAGFKISVLVLLVSAAVLLFSAYADSLIPFWILLAFSLLFMVEKWFGNPERKHKHVGILYRIALNVIILPYPGFVIWSGFRLFSQHFMRTPLIGSLVFLFELISLVWLWQTFRKNRWRWPGMKLTFGFLIAAVVIFSFAGIQPFARYKDEGITRVRSFFNNLP